jgi:RIO-like serine/threonine protein kinase
LERVFKHDFFAATALYKSTNHKGQPSEPERVVLKVDRQQHFLGLPLRWLGRALCEHEVSVLKKIGELEQVPKFLWRYGDTGFVYRYIEGKPLREVKEVPNDFFDRLEELLESLHRRNIYYVDMDKRDNIILGRDGRPHMIDFQISVYIDKHTFILPMFSRFLQDLLLKADRYHMFKHKRRLQPESLKPAERELSYCRDGFIKLHRAVTVPVRQLRRRLLNLLQKNGFLAD